VFDRFCALHGGLDPQAFEHVDPPDFVALDRSLAVELVEYHNDLHTSKRGSPRRRREALLEGLLCSARVEIEKQLRRQLNVYAFPNLGFLPEKAERTEGLALLLADAVLNSIRAGKEDVEREGLPDKLPRYLSHLSFSFVPSHHFDRAGNWQIAEAAWREANVGAVRHIIEGRIHTSQPTERPRTRYGS
jgi:hypothetical protein